VTDTLGPALDQRSPEYRWIRSIIRSVEKRIGNQTGWNGRVFEEPDPSTLGAVYPDGSMSVSRANVLEPVRRAFEGSTLPALDAYLTRDATLTVIHEAVHLCSHPGDLHHPTAHAVEDEAELSLEEGLAEAWTHAYADDVIFDIDMDRSVPAVLGPVTSDSYPAYRAATITLVDGLGQQSGVWPQEVMRQLLSSTRAQRWNAAAQVLMDHARSGTVPAADRDEVRQDLVAPLRKHFARLPAIEERADLNEAEKARDGSRVAWSALSELSGKLADLRARYQPAQHARPRLSISSELDRLRKFLGDQPQSRPSRPAERPVGSPARTRAGPPSGRDRELD
jgi:hypothetical protein